MHKTPPGGGVGGRGSIISSRSNLFQVLCVLLFSCRLNYARTKNQRTFCLDIASAEILFVSPAKQKRDIVLLFRHRRCCLRRRCKLLLSFCVQVIFSETIRAGAMKPGSCIHLEELRSLLHSIVSFDLLFTVH